MERMHQQGFPIPRDFIYLLLQDCTKKKDLAAARQAHSLAVSSGLDVVAALGDHFIRVFALLAGLLEANIAFSKIAKPSAFTWHAIISAHAMHGECEKAIELYRTMQCEGVKPTRFVFSSILKACGIVGALQHGEEVHDRIITIGLEADPYVGSTLIDMYTKCYHLEEARNIFDKLQTQDVVSWNTMIAGYVQYGHGHSAFELFERMHFEGIKPVNITFVCILKACGSMGAIDQGELIHDLIIRYGLESDVIMGSTIVDMYAKCGSPEKAHLVFDQMVRRNIVSWNAIIAGYVQHGHARFALQLFDQMQQEGTCPDRVSFLCLLKAGGSLEEVGQGRLIHIQILKNGLESDVSLGSTLIDMYSKCGCMGEAQNVFDKLASRSVVSWCVMIAGYAQHGYGISALELLERMQQKGIEPDKVSFLWALKACATVVGGLGKSRLIHNQIVKCGFELDIIVGSTLIEMYAKCGDFDTAQTVLEELPSRDVVSWGALIAGYVEQGNGVTALQIFLKMEQDGIIPDNAAYSLILKACSCIGAIAQGKLIHDQIIRCLPDLDVVVGTALVEMYGQCGALEEACNVFKKLTSQNVVLWNAMIAAYARHSNIVLASQCLEDMQKHGSKPDGRTLTSILVACCHAGDVEQGLWFFKNMKSDHGVTPGIQHYNCLINLLGCAGLLHEAHELVQKMPMPPDITGLRSLLASSRKFGNIDLGRQCFEEAIQMDSYTAAEYVLMSNIYTESHMWDDACKVHELRKSAGAFKKPGMAWIEGDRKIHEFIVGDESHLQSDIVDFKVRRLKRFLNDEGCMPQLNLMWEPMCFEGMVEPCVDIKNCHSFFV